MMEKLNNNMSLQSNYSLIFDVDFDHPKSEGFATSEKAEFDQGKCKLFGFYIKSSGILTSLCLSFTHFQCLARNSFGMYEI